MSAKTIRHSLILIFASFIWGVAFVAQSEGGDAVGPYSFNCIRCLIGGFSLVIAIFIRDKFIRKEKRVRSASELRALLMGGFLCGLAVAAATTLQQLGLFYGTPAGKAGFLTACYIILVPILGIFLKRRCGWNIWLGVALTVVGLYLLCMNGSLQLQFSDILIGFCALMFALQILLVDHYAPHVDGMELSCVQFLVCGLTGLVPMVFSEILPQGIAGWCSAFTSFDAWIPILYAGVLSCGVAYTLQIVGQVGLNPTVASLLMSLESVFSVLAGWLLLHQALSARELTGCAIIFCAIVLAQLPTASPKEAA